MFFRESVGPDYIQQSSQLHKWQMILRQSEHWPFGLLGHMQPDHSGSYLFIPDLLPNINLAILGAKTATLCWRLISPKLLIGWLGRQKWGKKAAEGSKTESNVLACL